MRLSEFVSHPRLAAGVAVAAVATSTATIALAADQPPAGEAAPVPLLAPAGALAAGLHLDATLRDASAAARRAHVSRRVLRLARRVAHVRGETLPRGYSRRLDHRTTKGLLRKEHRLHRALREWRTTGGAPAVAIPAALASIAACESGGNPQAIGGGGAFRGKYQFSYATWAAVGGSGDPAAASEVEQDRRAAMLYAQSGAGQWPVCGR